VRVLGLRASKVLAQPGLSNATIGGAGLAMFRRNRNDFQNMQYSQRKELIDKYEIFCETPPVSLNINCKFVCVSKARGTCSGR
jgi:hypothetical protein